MMGKEIVSYLTAEKLKIIKYAEMNGNRAAGREFKVNEHQTVAAEKRPAPTTPKEEDGRETFHPQMEEQLNAWIQDVRQQGIGVSTTEVKIKAKIIAKQMKIATFKASQGWCNRFFRRHNLSMRRRTHIAQRLPEDYEDKVTDFQRFVIQQRKRNDYAPARSGMLTKHR